MAQPTTVFAYVDMFRDGSSRDEGLSRLETMDQLWSSTAQHQVSYHMDMVPMIHMVHMVHMTVLYGDGN